MKNNLINNFIKKICIIVFITYVGIVFCNQQQTLASYNSQKDDYTKKIETAKKYNDALLTKKENLDSNEYIETICREKLDMYSENEKVYININK